jgi:hypothetical protein
LSRVGMQGDPTAKTDSSIANLASRIPVLVYASGELMHAVRKGQYAVERESAGDVQAGGPQQCLQSSRVSTHLMSLLSNPSPSALRVATCARPVVSPPQNSTCLRQTATGACRRAVQVKSGGMQGARGVVARTRIINMQGRWVCCTRVLSCRCEAIELVLRLFACLV